MGFRTTRGRPPKPARATVDLGTRELQEKRRQSLTEEPLDTLLRHKCITNTQHRAGMHLRWLYTLCYGTPLPGMVYDDSPQIRQEPHEWRQEREAEYRQAVMILQSRKLLRCLLNCCLFHLPPVDENGLKRLRQGLDMLIALWGYEQIRKS